MTTWARKYDCCCVSALTGAGAEGTRGRYEGTAQEKWIHRESGSKSITGHYKPVKHTQLNIALNCLLATELKRSHIVTKMLSFPETFLRNSTTPLRSIIIMCFAYAASLDLQEAAVLVSQRSMNPREFFRQLSSSSSLSPTSPGSTRSGVYSMWELRQSHAICIYLLEGPEELSETKWFFFSKVFKEA